MSSLAMTGRRRLLRDAAIVVGLVFAAYLFMVAEAQKGTVAYDIVAYYNFDLAQPYAGVVGQLGFFAYSPPIALLLAPFHALPWLWFVTGWLMLLLAAAAWLGRGNLLLILALPPVAIDLYHGNIHLLLAVAVALGMRYPAAWSFVLLTKVTPGVGLLWFVVRREWRRLAHRARRDRGGRRRQRRRVARPVGSLAGDARQQRHHAAAVAGDSSSALAAAAGGRSNRLVGRKTDRPWTIALSAALALPALWPGGFAILAAYWRLSKSDADYHAPDGVGPRSRAAILGRLTVRPRPA